MYFPWEILLQTVKCEEEEEEEEEEEQQQQQQALKSGWQRLRLLAPSVSSLRPDVTMCTLRELNHFTVMMSLEKPTKVRNLKP